MYQINKTMGEPVNSNNLKPQKTYFSRIYAMSTKNFKEIIKVTGFLCVRFGCNRPASSSRIFSKAATNVLIINRVMANNAMDLKVIHKPIYQSRVIIIHNNGMGSVTLSEYNVYIISISSIQKL